MPSSSSKNEVEVELDVIIPFKMMERNIYRFAAYKKLHLPIDKPHFDRKKEFFEIVRAYCTGHALSRHTNNDRMGNFYWHQYQKDDTYIDLIRKLKKHFSQYPINPSGTLALIFQYFDTLCSSDEDANIKNQQGKRLDDLQKALKFEISALSVTPKAKAHAILCKYNYSSLPFFTTKEPLLENLKQNNRFTEKSATEIYEVIVTEIYRGINRSVSPSHILLMMLPVFKDLSAEETRIATPSTVNSLQI